MTTAIFTWTCAALAEKIENYSTSAHGSSVLLTQPASLRSSSSRWFLLAWRAVGGGSGKDSCGPGGGVGSDRDTRRVNRCAPRNDRFYRGWVRGRWSDGRWSRRALCRALGAMPCGRKLKDAEDAAFGVRVSPRVQRGGAKRFDFVFFAHIDVRFAESTAAAVVAAGLLVRRVA